MKTWQPVPGNLITHWAEQVDPTCPLPEYPRPQMEREEWLNLNGLWNYAVTPKDQSYFSEVEGQILVPFSIESSLSGVKRPLMPDERNNFV